MKRMRIRARQAKGSLCRGDCSRNCASNNRSRSVPAHWEPPRCERKKGPARREMSFTLLRRHERASERAEFLRVARFPSRVNSLNVRLSIAAVKYERNRLVKHRHFYLRKSNRTSTFLFALSDFLLCKYRMRV